MRAKYPWAILAGIIAAVLAWPGDSEAREQKPKKTAARHASKPAAKKPSAEKKGKSQSKPNPGPHHSSAPKAEADDGDDPLLPDFEQDAAELRQWLRQRDVEREHEGFDEAEEAEAGTETAETTPELAERPPRRMNLSLTGNRNRQPGMRQVTGRQRHVLDPSRPIHLSLDPSAPASLEDMELYDPPPLPARSRSAAKTPRAKAPAAKHAPTAKPKKKSDKPDKPAKRSHR